MISPRDQRRRRTHIKKIIVDSLTNIKNFVSSWGVTVQDFFSIDKKRFDPEVKG